MEYASRAVGNAGLTTGIIGTSLGFLSGVGGLAGLLGIGPKPSEPSDPGDRSVTRYEMGLYQQINDKNNEIALLKSNQYADFKADGLQAQINQQAVWNAVATANLGNIGKQIEQLYSVTRFVVPDTSVVAMPAPVPASTSTGN